MQPPVYGVSDRVVTPPVSMPTRWLTDIRQHVRQGQPDDDVLLESLLITARLHVETTYGVALLTQTREMQVDGWPVSRCWLPFPMAPVQSIESVVVVDDDGTTTSVSADDYWFDGGHRPPRLVWNTEPSTRRVRVQYVAGYGVNADDIPADLLHVLKLLVGYWYGAPTAAVSGALERQIEFGVEALMTPHALVAVG